MVVNEDWEELLLELEAEIAVEIEFEIVVEIVVIIVDNDLTEQNVRKRQANGIWQRYLENNKKFWKAGIPFY